MKCIQNHQSEQHIKIVESQQFGQIYPISVGGVQFDFGHVHGHQHKVVAIAWYVVSIVLQHVYGDSNKSFSIFIY